MGLFSGIAKGDNDLIQIGQDTTYLLFQGKIEKILQEALANIDTDLREQFQQGIDFLSDETTEKSRSLLEPYRAGGIEAFNKALGLQGIGPNAVSKGDLESEFLNQPGIRFQIDQGTRAIESSASSRGLLGSGRILKELSRYGQGLASQRFGQQQDELARLAGLGANAAAQSANLGQQTQLAKAQLSAGLGTALAGNQQNIANLRSSALSQATVTQTQKSQQKFLQERILAALGGSGSGGRY